MIFPEKGLCSYSIVDDGNAIQQEVMSMGEHLFERLARERGISVEDMREIISKRIEQGWNSDNPVKREQWRKIPCAGEMPTPDEWLRYAVERIKDDGREDLLRKYSIR